MRNYKDYYKPISGEDWNVNPEISLEIKKSKPSYSVGTEPV